MPRYGETTIEEDGNKKWWKSVKTKTAPRPQRTHLVGTSLKTAKSKRGATSGKAKSVSTKTSGKGKAKSTSITKSSSVGKKSKIVKSPVHREGYEAIKPKQTEGPAGYELVQPKEGKGGYELVTKKGAPESLHSEQKSERKQKSKRKRVLLIVALGVVAIVTMGAMIGLIVFQTLGPNEDDHIEMIEPNEFCQKYIKSGNNSQCFYYEKKYVETCTKIECKTVDAKVKASTQIEGIDTIIVENDKEVRYPVTGAMPNHVPCRDGMWCVNGTCKSTTNSKVAKYSKRQPEDGRYQINCDRSTMCISLTSMPASVRERYPEPLACTNVECEPRNNSLKKSIVPKTGFYLVTQSCEPPKYGGKSCYRGDTEFPFLISRTCGKLCPGFVDETAFYFGDSCKQIDKDKNKDRDPQDCIRVCISDKNSTYTVLLPDGYPCIHSKLQESGYCFRGLCVPGRVQKANVTKIDTSK